jgi:hypothetical protein
VLNALNVDGGGQYAVKDLAGDTSGQNLFLEYDLYVNSVDYACGIGIGLFDTDYNS